MKLLDVFCGRGGWSNGFRRLGWETVGVDLTYQPAYRGEFVLADARSLTPEYLATFDAVVMSPPCEEFARASLPWLETKRDGGLLRASDLLRWAVNQSLGKKNRLVECSKFSARFVGGAYKWQSWCLWGDVPALLPRLDQTKTRTTGMSPGRRAEIPVVLADWVAGCFTRQL